MNRFRKCISRAFLPATESVARSQPCGFSGKATRPAKKSNQKKKQNYLGFRMWKFVPSTSLLNCKINCDKNWKIPRSSSPSLIKTRFHLKYEQTMITIYTPDHWLKTRFTKEICLPLTFSTFDLEFIYLLQFFLHNYIYIKKRKIPSFSPFLIRASIY